MNMILQMIKTKLLEIMATLTTMDRQRKRLYDTAFAMVGHDASPKDYAPDDFGCAESVSSVIRKAFPELNFPMLLSTKQLYAYLEQSPSFERAESPGFGLIILSVTGAGNGSVSNGHTGVIGRYISYDGSQWVMSNDSRTGLWTPNMTVTSWKHYFEQKGGMAALFYRVR